MSPLRRIAQGAPSVIGSTGAFLAAVFLTREARWHDPDLVPALRRSALWAGVVVGVLAAAGLLVVRLDAPRLFDSLFGGPALVFVVVSIVAGVLSLVLLWARRFLVVRPVAGLAVAAILWGWGVAQYPNMLPGITVEMAAATARRRTSLPATAIVRTTTAYCSRDRTTNGYS